MERIILKCTQRDPNDRYQSTAELMYALEHYEEIDDIYKKKQKKKLWSFLTTSILTVAFGITSIWGYMAAEGKKSENYDVILKNATGTADYYEAILTDPTRTEAYLSLNDYLSSDYMLNKEEGKELLKLMAGLDQRSSTGFSENVDVLKELKNDNPTGYDEVCFAIGWNFLSYYDTDIDRDRYSSAAKWFSEIKDNENNNGAIAAIFYDISECTNKINQLRGGKVIQTQELNKQRENLWTMLKNLKTKSDGYAEDYRLQVWIEIDGLINNNIGDFLEVTTPEEMIKILNEINEGISKIKGSNPDIIELIEELKASTAQTIARIETAKE